MTKKLSTEAYKGTRDFYPKDMAIQRYIFDMWAKTAESFGYERYDASILEPSELYKSKGAENEEMVNEQTYTFTDRGDREVTLRPEMTPTVARMVAGKRRDLTFPVRWYSIPNLFRYERPQRGRLREHWQLNCDMFGVDDISADVEMIALAYNVLKAFGANDSDFEIRVNNRQLMTEFFIQRYGINDSEIISKITRILDQKKKVTEAVFDGLLKDIVQENFEQLKSDLEISDVSEFTKLLNTEVQNSTLILAQKGLESLGIKIVFDPTLARGFDYYTGTIFEIFDTSPDNNRSLLGGGRYDNLTSLFEGEPVSGIGFGMGDVTMRDFLETHGLLEGKVPATSPTIIVIPNDATQNLDAQKVAAEFRTAGIKITVDISDRKADKKKSTAEKTDAKYILTFTDNTGVFTLRALRSKDADVIDASTNLIRLILGNLNAV